MASPSARLPSESASCAKELRLPLGQDQHSHELPHAPRRSPRSAPLMRPSRLRSARHAGQGLPQPHAPRRIPRSAPLTVQDSSRSPTQVIGFRRKPPRRGERALWAPLYPFGLPQRSEEGCSRGATDAATETWRRLGLQRVSRGRPAVRTPKDPSLRGFPEMRPRRPRSSS